MNILMTGGTGFIGQHLCRSLTRHNNQVTVLSRIPNRVPAICGPVCNGVGSIDDLGSDSEFDAIINLAGEPIIARRWTARRKEILRNSRAGTTRKIAGLIERSATRPSVLINASAVGYYGDQGDQELDESSPARDDFGHRLCVEWESEGQKAAAFGVRVCIIRIGLVIGEQGGFLKPMVTPFNLGLGGPISDGKQWMSWIHRDDLICIIERLLDDPSLSGVFNATTPSPATSRDFAKTLARLLGRPAIIPVPRLLLAMLLGERSMLLTGGQKALPVRLIENGFRFKYDQLEAALRQALERPPEPNRTG